MACAENPAHCLWTVSGFEAFCLGIFRHVRTARSLTLISLSRRRMICWRDSKEPVLGYIYFPGMTTFFIESVKCFQAFIR